MSGKMCRFCLRFHDNKDFGTSGYCLSCESGIRARPELIEHATDPEVLAWASEVFV